MRSTRAEIGSRRSRFLLSDRILQLSSFTRYALAIGVTVVSVAVRLALDPLWQTKLPYITLFPAIMLSAWVGGAGPGIVTTLTSGIAAAYFWVAPGRSWAIVDSSEWFGLLAFVFVGIVISALNEAWRRGVRSLASSEESLDVTIGSIGDAVIATDDRGRVTRLNAVAENLTGWSRADAFGKPLNEVFVIVDEQSRQPVENPVSRVLRDGLVAGLANHTLLLARDGRAVPIDDSAAPIRGAEGVTSGVILVFRDISERRRIEAERETQDRISRELAAIVESSDDAIVSKDLESRIRSWNRGAERMFGYTAEEAVGRSIRIIIPEERWSEEDDVLRQLRRGEKVDHFETVRRRKDGAELIVSLTISPIRSSSGTVIGASKIARDITAMKRAEQEQAQLFAREQEARAEVERASRLKDDFLAVLSHELRTPLNAVMGYSQLLSAGILPPARAAHAIQAIQRNAQAQARLVESLLDLSRVMAGKLALNLEEIDLGSVIESAVDALRPEAETKSISLDVRMPPARMRMVGDAARLQQVFWNLLSNAIKFTRGPGRVIVTGGVHEEHLRVSVADQGQGISPEFLPHVFDRFRQGASTDGHSPAGLGLGLALVREMVQAHGGTVVAESAGEGSGSTFTVTLPPRAVGEPVPVPEASLPDAEAGVAGLQILIVEDERDAREFLALLLASRGAVVRTAASGSEAFAAMSGQRPDLLLADLRMPEEDGYSLIRRWRAHETEHPGPRVAAIAVTAYASPNDRDQAIAAGFDSHVAKPVDAAVLAAAIGRVRGWGGFAIPDRAHESGRPLRHPREPAGARSRPRRGSAGRCRSDRGRRGRPAGTDGPRHDRLPAEHLHADPVHQGERRGCGARAAGRQGVSGGSRTVPPRHAVDRRGDWRRLREPLGRLAHDGRTGAPGMPRAVLPRDASERGRNLHGDNSRGAVAADLRRAECADRRVRPHAHAVRSDDRTHARRECGERRDAVRGSGRRLAAARGRRHGRAIASHGVRPAGRGRARPGDRLSLARRLRSALYSAAAVGGRDDRGVHAGVDLIASIRTATSRRTASAAAAWR